MSRELLEAAAKAYGLTGHRYAEGVGMMAAYTPQDGFHGPWWSSLEDDGDALRLLVKLELSVHTCGQGVYVAAQGNGRILAAAPECTKAERPEVVRRQITRAAACFAPARVLADGQEASA